ncbi:NAD(P)-binding protein [Macrolepiota fuliginosa MF-IS2]|uniref:NAD(P)-binding protein n=1 Tax=Macrolepiota fuliginosa MF-IS2 TaxID=1400762 RepID=A0A9P5X501_9AGAR|nr:NAD(P)-binding protein [Macrolepiota fuliginosa MF-IS2]
MTSKKSFKPDRDLADLTGKVVFVTGSNRGIGLQTVKHLARKGATVYLGSRSEEAGKAAVSQLEKEGIPKGRVIYAWCDFSTTGKAKETGEKLLGQIDRLDIYVLNGAMYVVGFLDSCEAIEDPLLPDLLTANHFGNLRLLQILLPLIEETSDKYGEARIVTVSSMAHTLSRAKDPDIQFKTPDDFRQDYGPGGGFRGAFAYYAVSKLCQQMTHTVLHKRNKHPNLIFISVDPGMVNTFSNTFLITRILSPIINLFFDSPEVGAYNTLFAAASPKVKEKRDKYDGKFLTPVGKLTPVGANVTLEKAEEMLETSQAFLEKEDMFPLLPRGGKEGAASSSS